MQYDLRFPVLISAAIALFFGSLAFAYETPTVHAPAASVVQTK